MLHRQYEVSQLPVQQALWPTELPSQTFDPSAMAANGSKTRLLLISFYPVYKNQHTTGSF